MSNDRDSHPLLVRLLGDPAAREWIRELTGAVPERIDSVQTLWSGYGEVVRVHLKGGSLPSVIIKWVEPSQTMDHPRGWAGSASHERKLRSYAVEQRFYTDWIPSPHPTFRTARCYQAEAIGNGWRFLFEDLDAAGFAGRPGTLTQNQIEQCLRWLATFHGHFLQRQPTGLWEVGTYWHLATRQEELAALQDPRLRAAAPQLDAALRGCPYRTLVHGDAKVANFCFGPNGVAAVDFQYVGGGCGVQDVAYFLSSCLTDEQCEAEAQEHLGNYFRYLRAAIDPAIDSDAVIEAWQDLYPAAWADFHRFLAGWAPGHWKIHDYTRRMTELALADG